MSETPTAEPEGDEPFPDEPFPEEECDDDDEWETWQQHEEEGWDDELDETLMLETGFLLADKRAKNPEWVTNIKKEDIPRWEEIGRKHGIPLRIEPGAKDLWEGDLPGHFVVRCPKDRHAEVWKLIEEKRQ